MANAYTLLFPPNKAALLPFPPGCKVTLGKVGDRHAVVDAIVLGAFIDLSPKSNRESQYNIVLAEGDDDTCTRLVASESNLSFAPGCSVQALSPIEEHVWYDGFVVSSYWNHSKTPYYSVKLVGSGEILHALSASSIKYLQTSAISNCIVAEKFHQAASSCGLNLEPAMKEEGDQVLVATGANSSNENESRTICASDSLTASSSQATCVNLPGLEESASPTELDVPSSLEMASVTTYRITTVPTAPVSTSTPPKSTCQDVAPEMPRPPSSQHLQPLVESSPEKSTATTAASDISIESTKIVPDASWPASTELEEEGESDAGAVDSEGSTGTAEDLRISENGSADEMAMACTNGLHGLQELSTSPSMHQGEGPAPAFLQETPSIFNGGTKASSGDEGAVEEGQNDFSMASPSEQSMKQEEQGGESNGRLQIEDQRRQPQPQPCRDGEIVNDHHVEKLYLPSWIDTGRLLQFCSSRIQQIGTETSTTIDISSDDGEDEEIEPGEIVDRHGGSSFICVRANSIGSRIMEACRSVEDLLFDFVPESLRVPLHYDIAAYHEHGLVDASRMTTPPIISIDWSKSNWLGIISINYTKAKSLGVLDWSIRIAGVLLGIHGCRHRELLRKFPRCRISVVIRDCRGFPHVSVEAFERGVLVAALEYIEGLVTGALFREACDTNKGIWDVKDSALTTQWGDTSF